MQGFATVQIADVEVDLLGSCRVLGVVRRLESAALRDLVEELLRVDVEVKVEASALQFELELTNLDQFSGTQATSLVFPAGDGPSKVTVGDESIARA